MIKVNVVAVGKVKEKYFESGIAEYSKRLSAFCDFKIIEVEEENFKKTDDSLALKTVEKEGEKILSKLSGKVVVLTPEGEKKSSEGFAEIIKSAISKGENLTFVIGGSYGLSSAVKQKADKKISFSDMTFPHTLFRLMLTEQIFRSFTILNGKNYHK